MRALVLALALASAPLAAPPAGAAEAEPDELGRTWAASLVYLPGRAEPARLSTLDLAAEAATGKRFPAIVYLHGCNGLSPYTDLTGRFLAALGYVVLMPDGFARLDKPKSCEVSTTSGGLHRAVLGWRQAEAAHAIRQAPALPFVEFGDVVLMGLSEGGATTATFKGAPVRARIIEGWTCHAGWPEYHGLAATPDEPVLALLGADDPWFVHSSLKGDCGAYLAEGNGSRSVVYRAPHLLAPYHYLTWHVEPLSEIVEFLNRLRAAGK